MASTIPYHSVTACSNIGTRCGIFDKLMESGIFSGGPKEASARIGRLPDGELIQQEFEHYVKGSACPTCFWKMLDYHMTECTNEVRADKNTLCFEVEMHDEDLMDDACMARLLKQKTQAITDYCYRIDEQGDGSCRVRMVYVTKEKERLHTKTLERIFGEDAVIDNKKNLSGMALRDLLEDPRSKRYGKWNA